MRTRRTFLIQTARYQNRLDYAPPNKSLIQEQILHPPPIRLSIRMEKPPVKTLVFCGLMSGGLFTISAVARSNGSALWTVISAWAAVCFLVPIATTLFWPRGRG